MFALKCNKSYKYNMHLDIRWVTFLTSSQFHHMINYEKRRILQVVSLLWSFEYVVHLHLNSGYILSFVIAFYLFICIDNKITISDAVGNFLVGVPMGGCQCFQNLQL